MKNLNIFTAHCNGNSLRRWSGQAFGFELAAHCIIVKLENYLIILFLFIVFRKYLFIYFTVFMIVSIDKSAEVLVVRLSQNEK